MNRMLLMTCIFVVATVTCHCRTIAQTMNFELQGMAEAGISAANEPAEVIDGGSGDIASAISVNLSTGLLTIDIEWGSANGYIDLSSDIDFMNIHGPTEGVAPGNFTSSTGTLTGLDGFDPSASSGGYTGQVIFSQTNIRELLEGRFYIHLHTFVNNNGEARGYMIPDVVVGDINGDGQINLLDVGPFVQVIVDGLFIDEADINRDGSIDLLDIQPFINLLSG